MKYLFHIVDIRHVNANLAWPTALLPPPPAISPPPTDAPATCLIVQSGRLPMFRV